MKKSKEAYRVQHKRNIIKQWELPKCLQKAVNRSWIHLLMDSPKCCIPPLKKGN